MADLPAQFQESLSLQTPIDNDTQTLQKKRSQRFTVQRQAMSPAPPLPQMPPMDAFQQHMDRTLSSDSSESLPYGYPQAPIWFNPVISRPDMSAFAPPTPISPPQMMSHESMMAHGGPMTLLPGQEEATDEIIPTAIVIKNIPFSVPREQVMAIMDALNLNPPYAFNYHYDIGPSASSTFRGLAFANFRDPAETTAALAALNGYEIQGRRLRVEYKRVLRHGEKEKIEREKAIKRMRSAAGLNVNGLPLYQIPPGLPPPLPMGLHHEDDYRLAGQMPMQQQYDSSPNVWGSVGSHPPPSPYSQPPPASTYVPAQQPPAPQEMVGSPGSSDLGSGGADPSSSSQSSSVPAPKAELDMNDSQTLEIYSRVLLFKDDSLRDELAFARSLSGVQRRTVHLVAQRLGLEHKSVGEGEDRYVVVYKISAIDSDAQQTLGRHASISDLRSKKSEPNLRISPTASINNIASRKSNADLRSASRRDRPTLQGVFQHPTGPIPPMPALRNQNSYEEPLHSPPSPTNGLSSSPLRQPRGPTSHRTNSTPGRSNAASNWRLNLNSTTVSNLDMN